MSDDPFSIEPDALGGDLPEEMHGRIKSELVPGERVLWAGRAIARPVKPGCGYLAGGGIALTLFFFGGLALAAALGVLPRLRSREPDDFFTGIICSGIGAFVVFAMFATWRSKKAEQARTARQLYSVTDRRAIIWKPAISTDALEIHSIGRGRIETVHRIEYPDGSGDVVFNFPGGPPVNHPDYIPDSIRFKGIPEVRRVEDLVRRTLLPPDSGMISRQ